MNAADYSFLLSHPEAVNERQTDALEKIVTEFPYFQSARALRLKGLYNQNSFQYNYALKVTAAYTTDRSVLFDFITSDSFTAIQKGLYQQKLAEIEDIAVTDSTVLGDDKAVERPSDTELAKQSILESIRESESRAETDAEALETLQNTPEIVEEEIINAEDFGPVEEEPQFLPEAVAPVEFTHIELEEPVVDAKAAELEVNPLETVEETVDGHIEETIETPETELDSSDSEQAQQVAPIEIAAETNEETRGEAELSEAKLDIGKPLEFSKDETHSFAEWLQLTSLRPIVRGEEETIEVSAEITAPEIAEQPEKISQDAIIDRFIESNPKMPKANQEITPVSIRQKDDHSALMTETLARVYLEQRKYQKAIQAYEILILKYPEKSSFFADRISEIKNLQQNNIL